MPLSSVPKELVKEYGELLTAYRLQDRADKLPNRYPWHCRMAVSALARAALEKQLEVANASKDRVDFEKRVSIYLVSDTASNNMYGDSIDTFQKFVAAGGAMRVLVMNPATPVDTNYLFSLSRKHPSQVQFRVATANDHEMNHFMLVGDQAYRYEAKHGEFSEDELSEGGDYSPEVPASICFNDPVGAGYLQATFDLAWKKADRK